MAIIKVELSDFVATLTIDRLGVSEMRHYSWSGISSRANTLNTSIRPAMMKQ